MSRQRAPQLRRDARRLRSILAMLVRRFALSERADVACCGMTVAQAATLEVLRTEGATRLGALGRRLGISPSTLTRNLRRLQARGLLTRLPDPDDTRAALVSLSEAGRRAATRIVRQEESFAMTILEQFRPGRSRAALTSMEELLAAVRGATESCCPGAFDHLMKEFPGGSSR
jgi:DNA-binding MarR family transcriptional regulator